VLAAFYGIIFSLASLVQKNFKDLGNIGMITVMLITAFLFQPIRNWIQERLDKHFYRDRYDYRRTLVEFARELSSETDLDAMLASVGERLRQTLSIKHMAFFLAEEGARRSRIPAQAVHGRQPPPGRRRPRRPGSQLSQLEAAGTVSLLPAHASPARRRLARLAGFGAGRHRRSGSHLLPALHVRGRTIAYMGVSRTADGDYLSSVDVELLLTLAGYVAIAIENASLYRSLQRKVEEYERLKEFSENIVESINVGILAADLDDRVESWNTQIERLSGISREHAVGRTLSELFPMELAGEFDRVRGQTGIHHIYKFVLKPAAGGAPPGPAMAMATVNGHGPRSLRETTLNIAIAPLVSKDQEQIGRLIIFDDVTDRAELEQRLVQADKLSSIGLLAAGVAHEVNTPLAVISTYAQMLAKQVSDDSQKSLILDKIAKQTFRASEIVNSLLNFSRTSTTSFGRRQPEPRDSGDALAAGAPASEVRNPGQDRSGRRPAARPRQRRQASAGVPQSLPECPRRHVGGRTLEVRTWPEGSGARSEVADTGHGHRPRKPAPHLRSVLHHQGCAQKAPASASR
jgi:two-component system NtrC family sensor kinase